VRCGCGSGSRRERGAYPEEICDERVTKSRARRRKQWVWNFCGAVLSLLPESAMDEDVARTVCLLQAAILFDFVKMKMKGPEREPERCEEVVRVVRGMLRTARWTEIAKLPVGKRILIGYGIALVRQPESGVLEVTEAFQRLREVGAGGPPWSNNAALVRAKDWIRTCEAAREALARFDPEKKNARIADTEWPVVLERMHRLIRHPDLRRMEACRKDHTALIDHLYEDPRNQGLDASGRPARNRKEPSGTATSPANSSRSCSNSGANVSGVKIKIAELQIANEDYDGALRTLWDVKSGERDASSELYLKTSIQISRVHRMKGDAKSAVEYPQFMLLGGPWQKYFPDIHEFLEWYYRNGASRPQEVAPAGKTKLDYRIRTPDEKKLIEELEPAYRKGRREDLPPSVVWRYEFIKRKVEQARELDELERLIRQPAPEMDEAARAKAQARHAALERIGAAKTRPWKLMERIDEAIVDLGSVERARKEKAALFEERERLQRETNELETQLKGL